MKKFLITTGTALGISLGIHLIAFGREFTTRSISDTVFIVGIMMFFISLTSITGAGKIFTTFGYAIRSVFGRQHKKYDNLYDYHQAKDKNRIGSYGLPMFLIGVIMVAISLILAFNILNN